MPAKAKKSAAVAAPAAPILKPNWPPFKPLLPTSDLSLEVVAPNQIVTISNFWTSTLCKTYVSFLATLPLSTTPGKPKRGDAVRVNDRFQVDDPDFARRLWAETALQEIITGEAASLAGEGNNPSERWGGEVIGLNPNIRVYRYSPGQFFDQHYDESNNVEIDGMPARTTWTLLLYLTSSVNGCIGGETVFYPEPFKGSKKTSQLLEPVIAELEVGKVLLHKHGKDCMLHEGREVTQGEKWVLRTDLCVRR